MTQDQRLEAALARLTTALASLEAAAGKARSPEPAPGAEEPGLDAALEHARAKIERLEAANDAVSRVLKDAIAALATVVPKPPTPGAED